MSVHDYRLSSDDELRITASLAEFLDTLRVNVVQSGHAWNVHAQLSSSFNVETARRLMAHSIGCSLADLRDSEIEHIDGLITAASMA